MKNPTFRDQQQKMRRDCADCTTHYFAKIFLIVFNVIVILFGLVVLFVAIAGANKFSDELKQVDVYAPVAVTIAFGALLVLLGILGLCGVARNARCLLAVNILCIAVLTIGVLAAGIAMILFSNQVDLAQGGDISSTLKQDIIDMELATFRACCTGIFVGNNNEPFECSVLNIFPCISNKGNFDDLVQVIVDNNQICETLAELDFNGDPLVGETDDGGCGGGDGFDVYVDDFSQFSQEVFQAAGITTVVLSCVVLVLLVFACIAMVARDEYIQKEEERKKRGC